MGIRRSSRWSLYDRARKRVEDSKRPRRSAGTTRNTETKVFAQGFVEDICRTVSTRVLREERKVVAITDKCILNLSHMKLVRIKKSLLLIIAPCIASDGKHISKIHTTIGTGNKHLRKYEKCAHLEVPQYTPGCKERSDATRSADQSNSNSRGSTIAGGQYEKDALISDRSRTFVCVSCEGGPEGFICG